MRHIVLGIAVVQLCAAVALAQTCLDSADGALVQKPKVTMNSLAAPPGDERLRFKGDVLFPFPFDPPFDPITNGVRVAVQDKDGGTITEETIPGGAYDSTTKVGWKEVNGRYKFQRGGHAVSGIRKVVIKDQSAHTPGFLQFTVVGKRAFYTVTANSIPIKAAIVFHDPTPGTNQCAKALFEGPVPEPVCTLDTAVTTLRCK